MKKTSKVLSVFLSVVMLVTVIAAPASAAFPLYQDFSTPYGSVHCEVQTQNMTPWEPDPLIGVSAGTSISSSQTMVWTHVAMEVQKESTGQVLFSDSEYTYNSNFSSVGCHLQAIQTLGAIVFTTHSVLYIKENEKDCTYCIYINILADSLKTKAYLRKTKALLSLVMV